ncbi:MAG: YIP1 family protein [Bacillota bacterium]
MERPETVEIPPQPMGILELIGGTLSAPRETLRRAAAERPLWLAGAVLVVSTAAGALPAAIAGLMTPIGPVLANPSTLVVIRLALALAGWLLWGAVVHATAGLLGGRGSVGSLLSGLALASAPQLLRPALSFINLTPLASAWLGVRVLLVLWTLGLQVLSVHEAEGLPTQRAALAVALPVLAAVLALGLIMWVSGTLAFLDLFIG